MTVVAEVQKEYKHQHYKQKRLT